MTSWNWPSPCWALDGPPPGACPFILFSIRAGSGRAGLGSVFGLYLLTLPASLTRIASAPYQTCRPSISSILRFHFSIHMPKLKSKVLIVSCFFCYRVGHLKSILHGHWNEGSVVKSSGFPSRGPGFDSQHPLGSSELFVTPAPGFLMPFPGL